MISKAKMEVIDTANGANATGTIEAGATYIHARCEGSNESKLKDGGNNMIQGQDIPIREANPYNSPQLHNAVHDKIDYEANGNRLIIIVYRNR